MGGKETPHPCDNFERKVLKRLLKTGDKVMKRYLRGIIHVGIIGLGTLLLLNSMVLQGIVMLLFSYFIFGFVASAYYFCSLKSFSKARFLVKITIPHLLLKVEKSYYYLLKSAFAMDFEKDYKKSIEYLRKVNEEYLSTENDKSLYNFSMAKLLYNQGEYIQALKNIEKAIEIPHKSLADEKYIKLYDKIKLEV